MSHPVFPALLLFVLAPAAVAGTGAQTGSPTESPDGGIDGVELAQLTIHQRIVIRIPRILGGRTNRPEPAEVRWEEKKGPKCVPMLALAGAIITGPDSVDLVVEDGTRLRAKFEGKCPALDFYSGLYVKGTPDGLVCADRDAIRSRSGSVCQIDGFRRLVARR